MPQYKSQVLHSLLVDHLTMSFSCSNRLNLQKVVFQICISKNKYHATPKHPVPNRKWHWPFIMQFVKLCSDYNFYRFRKTMLNNQCVIMHVTCYLLCKSICIVQGCWACFLYYAQLTSLLRGCLRLRTLAPAHLEVSSFSPCTKTTKKNFWGASSFFSLPPNNPRNPLP